MSFNTALFARMPKNKIGHSLYNRPKKAAGTMMHGDIVPIYCKLVSPGEVIKEKIYGNIRMSTPLTPLYSSIMVSFNAFFVPLRLIWDHTKEFFGENTSGTTPVVGTYTIPQVKINLSDVASTQIKVHSVAHYLGFPLYKGSSLDSGVNATSVVTSSVLKLRAYWATINRWYRHEQLQNPIVVSKLDTGAIGTKDGANLNPYSSCQKCLKDFDYFTTMTRYPQFGPDVSLPLGTVAPIVGDSNLHDLGSNGMFFNAPTSMNTKTYGLGIRGTSGRIIEDPALTSGTPVDTSEFATYVSKTNLVADLSSATAATIDELYLAMAAQAWYHNSNYGSRYFEMLEIHYSVSNPDLVLQDPEHIGEAKRFINVQQVLSTAGAASDTSTKLGQPGANSSTNIEVEFPRHSFGEWGYFLVLANTYHERYYSAGIQKEDLYTDLFDFFFPEFSNIGDVGVQRQELFAYSGDTDPQSIIGFQEAWSEMRYSPSQLTGLFDPYVNSDNGPTGYTAPIKGWVLSEKWATAPTLSESFLLENRDAITDMLVTGANGPDYLYYFFFDEKTLNEVPLYSIPGLPGRGRGLL